MIIVTKTQILDITKWYNMRFAIFGQDLSWGRGEKLCLA